MPAEAPTTIVHIAQIDISRESGMGRVAWHWRQELQDRGYTFLHIGLRETGFIHPAYFPYVAWRQFRRMGLRPAAFLVHEPSGVPFVRTGAPAIVFSHGLERSAWEATLTHAAASGYHVRTHSRFLFPLLRLRQADFSLRHARAVLVLNRDDWAGVQTRYGRRPEDVFLYRNGVDPAAPRPVPGEPPTVLFLGTWMARKGTDTLVKAAEMLRRRGVAAQYLVAGTGVAEAAVLGAWPEELRGSVRVLPSFPPAEEAALLAAADLFILPSFFEGQPLALLQAMSAGCCCLASDIAGHRDLIAPRRNGMLHSVGDAEDLAGQMEECLASPALRGELGSAARIAMAGRTWNTVAGEVADFIAGVLAK
ncbi:MAG TPA: glycosyltransferase family 4 protein [Thermoanaerobaculia bacterium]|jgi:glycosyltransferase involved in cell wall biosynthesis|nr:glycosyltransferase family 4 protein [Thermoanaerobaculia bacterium]